MSRIAAAERETTARPPAAPAGHTLTLDAVTHRFGARLAGRRGRARGPRGRAGRLARPVGLRQDPPRRLGPWARGPAAGPSPLGDSSLSFRQNSRSLIGRGIGAGAILACMASFDNVPVSLFLSDARTEVLPSHLWQIIDTSRDARAAAASGALIVTTLALMLLAERVAGLTKQLR